MSDHEPAVTEPQPNPESVTPPRGIDSSLTETSHRLTAAFSSLQGELEALHSATAQQEQRSADLDQREAKLCEHAAQLTDREHHLAEGHRELNEARERLLTEASEWKSREQEMAERERANALREKTIGEREAKALGPLQRWKARLEIRRKRLIKQRALLAERAAQLVRAKEALSQKLADSARMRALTGTMTPATSTESAPAAQRLAHPPKAAIFGGFVGGAAVALAVILGAAWWLAGVLDHPVFVASTSLKMENAAEARNDAVESWTAYHQELSVDPQMLEEVAKRFKQRGDIDLGTPTAVKRMLDTHLAIDSPERGRLNLTLTGEGRLKTQRLLETYTAAFVGFANDTRDRRLDRSNTVVASAANAGNEPAQSARVPLFAVSAAVMMAVTVVAGLGGVGLVTQRHARKEKPAVQEDSGEDRWSVDVR